jgi:hypothetical protein
MPAKQKGPANFAGPLASNRYVIASLRHYFGPSAVAALGVAHSAAGHVVLNTPETLTKPFSKLMSRTPQARLQCVLGHSEFFCGFSC